MSTFSVLLRRWRQLRELSQQQLAERAGVSARHVSFLETGRAGPSREMIERLAGALELSAQVRRELLESGGFVADWLPEALGARVGDPLQRALGLVLQQHEPYPALLVAQSGEVLRANSGAVRLVRLFAEPLPPEPWNMQGLLQSLRSSFEDWEAAIGYAAAFFALPSASSLPLRGDPASVPAVFEFRLQRASRSARLATVATQLAVASNAAEAGLRLELFQPLDEATEALLRAEP